MRKFVEVAALRKIPLFEGLSEEALSELIGLLHYKDVPPETTIITAGHPGEVVYIILEGSVRIVMDDNERNIILAVYGPGEVVGEMSVLDGMGRSASVITQEKSTLLWLGSTTFWEQLWKMEPVPFNMIRILNQRLRLCSTQLQAIAALDVNGRMAKQLLSFAKEHGRPVENGGVLIPLRLTQTTLADMIGASRVRVNQVLVYWKQQKHIELDAEHHITILNEKALMQYIQ